MVNIVNAIPEFTPDVETGTQEEGAESAPESPEGEMEKETPAEPPAAEEPVDVPEGTPHVDTSGLEKTVQGLQTERVKLLKEISELRGTRREIKQDQLIKVEERIDELKDLHPDDVSTIDRVLRAKGFVTKEEAQGMFYEAVKQEELNKFLEEFPEYKPENDPNNSNWNSLERELALYRRPGDPHQVRDLLLRAHRAIAKPTSDRTLPAKKRTVEIASVGSGGANRSSSHKALDPERRAMLAQGGWSEEDIRRIEKQLPE